MPKLLTPLLNIGSRQLFLVLFTIALWFLLVSWEYVVSLSMFGLVALSLFQWYPDKKHWRLRQTLPKALFRLRTDPSWLAASVPFFLVLFTSIYSADGDYTLNRLQVKLPFLVLPFVIAGIHIEDRRTYFQMHSILLILMCVAAIPVIFQYIQDPVVYNELLRQGRPLPTPSNHIRFSMVGALAFCSGLYLFQQRFIWKWQNERYIQVILLIFLFVFLHLLAVRSGLVVMYLGILLFIVRNIYLHRQWIKGIMLILLLASAPLGAYLTVPAFNAKIKYMMWDIHQMASGKIIDNSDSNRLISMQIGWNIFIENPVLGIGIGDVRSKTEDRYKAQYPHLKSLIPHNQWIYILAGSGIIGLILFVIGFFYPLIYRKRYKNYLLLVLLLIYFISYWFEPTIENNFGISILLLFMLPALHQDENNFGT